MIRRSQLRVLDQMLARNRVVGIIGARQVGKTTLARQYIRGREGKSHYFDLENSEHLARLEDPMLALKGLRGLVVIDEIQRFPDLFQTLRVLVDRPRLPARFLVLGSASPELLQQSSESLAGRIAYHELGGITFDEVGPESLDRLWLRGGFPRSYLARTNSESWEWRKNFIRTFLERDLPQLGVRIRSTSLRRFWTMLAHHHGQIWNASEFARSFGVADTTVRSYLDVLTASFVVRQLPPWHENISKRQVKAPKVFVSDSGVLHYLLGLRNRADLEGHPKIGASWEGFILEQVVQRLGAENEECFFWATHGGAELDLLVMRGRQRIGIEVKRTSSPRITRSMRSAMEDLQLRQLTVVHAGDDSFPMSRGIRAVAAARVLDDIRPLR
jgi:predicted AAA+ superfamily ATPase